MLASYSTQAVRDSTKKLAYWNGLHSSTFAPLEVRPADHARFEAGFQIGTLGATSIARTFSFPARIEHTAGHVARTSVPRFRLLMSLEGRVAVSHYGWDIELEAGDFTLIDDAAPFGIRFTEVNRALGLMLPRETLKPVLAAPERVCGLHMSGNRGLGAMVQAMLRGTWTQVEQGLPDAFGTMLARNLLEVAAGAYAIEHRDLVDASVTGGLRKMQIKRFVELNLRDSDLTPGRIARNFRVTPRYIRRIFAGDESLPRYILRRRLEESARELAERPGARRTVTEIALSWGFSSVAHFARSFRARYGVTPTEYRGREAAH